jgi:APA family basic amino acid/polyamine antiporter
MIAYTGMETISNLAEETRDPPRDVPRAYKLVAGAVFTIYLTLPAIALMALPVQRVGGEYVTKLGLGPEQGGFANDPVLGLVENVGLHGFALSGLKVYVGLLAGTILIIAANAGVIGSSRITYAMAGYRQLPEAFRRLHPRFKTPWLSLVVFSGLLAIATLLPGRIDFLGTMYSFGAMLSFAVANASLIALRARFPGEELQARSRPNVRVRGVDWPVLAFVGLAGTCAAWVTVVVQEPTTRWVGLGWMTAGFSLYVAYRRLVLHQPLSETMRAPVPVGPSVALEYRRIVVPVDGSPEALVAVELAARLAAERGARVTAVAPVVVPLERLLEDADPHAVESANERLELARAIGETYGVTVVPRLVRTRSAAEAIVAETEARQAEIVVLGTPRRAGADGRGPLLGRELDFVLRHAPCRVMLAAAPAERRIPSDVAPALRAARSG